MGPELQDLPFFFGGGGERGSTNCILHMEGSVHTLFGCNGAFQLFKEVIMNFKEVIMNKKPGTEMRHFSYDQHCEDIAL